MRKLLRRIAFALSRRREMELREEMSFHRDLAGSRAFGNDALAMNRARDVWLPPWWQDISQDLQFALRMLANDRRFTCAAIAALTLGMAVNMSMFTIIDAVLRDVPFDDPGRLVAIRTIDARGNETGSSLPDIHDWHERTHAFEGFSASTGGSMNVSESSKLAERLRGEYQSAKTFRLLRVLPILGRDFVEDDDRAGAPSVVILSYEVWRDRYNLDRDVIGRVVKINDVPTTIIGIMPDGFRYPMVTQAWQPLIHAPALAATASRREARTLGVMARVASRFNVESAAVELQTIATDLAAEYPVTNARTRVIAGPTKAAIARSVSPLLMTMMAAVSAVLLIACANLAALLLARSAQRSREIAIRASLGATRWRIVRQLLVECACLAVVAGTIGLGLSRYGANEIAVAFSPIGVTRSLRDARPYWMDLSIDAWTGLFVALLCIVVTFACGLIPALQVSRTSAHETLKEGGRLGGGLRARRWTAGLMIAQLAMTLVLLTAAGLVWRCFVTLYQQDPGVRTNGVVTAAVALPANKYSTPELRRQFFDALEARLSSTPRLSRSTLASHTPLVAAAGLRQISVAGQEPAQDTQRGVTTIAVGDHYFDTLDLPILAGRSLAPADARPGQEATVVSERVAQLFFSGETPLGRRIQLTTTTTPPVTSPWLTIVGIASTVWNQAPPGRDPAAVVYVPLRLEPTLRTATLVVRPDAPVDTAVTELRQLVQALDPDLPLYGVQTLDDALASSRLGGPRLLGTWASTLAIIALVVASVGMFALTAHGVAQRKHEIGVRLALGAAPRSVVWVVMRRAMAQLSVGVMLGLGGAIAATPLLQLFLGPMVSRDPVTILLVTLLLLMVATVATVLPARRAARIDPALTLRAE